MYVSMISQLRSAVSRKKLSQVPACLVQCPNVYLRIVPCICMLTQQTSRLSRASQVPT